MALNQYGLVLDIEDAYAIRDRMRVLLLTTIAVLHKAPDASCMTRTKQLQKDFSSQRFIKRGPHGKDLTNIRFAGSCRSGRQLG